jgi:cadmium resistance protein CadD (predicted permease)
VQVNLLRFPTDTSKKKESSLKPHHKVGAVFAAIGVVVMFVGFSFKQHTWGMVFGLIGLVPFFIGVAIATSYTLNNVN